MMPIDLVHGTAAVGTGVTAGVYVAFSTMVMPALIRIPSNHGLAAMQRINRLAVRSPFIVAFFGAAAASTGLLAMAGLRRDVPAASIIGAGLSLGTTAITIAVNQPLNRHLAGLVPEQAVVARAWIQVAHRWTRANHLRAAIAMLALVALSRS
jgi:uncharacterized membrane protein